MNRTEVRQRIKDLGYEYSHLRHYPCGLIWADNGRGTLGRFFLTILAHVNEKESWEVLAAGSQASIMATYKTLEMRA